MIYIKFSKNQLKILTTKTKHIFQNVPFSACNNCGERYIYAKIHREMEKEVDSRERKDIFSLYEFQEEMIEH